MFFFWYTRLQVYPVKEGLTGTGTIELLIKRVQTLGGQLTGQFLVDCDTYASSNLHQIGEYDFYLLDAMAMNCYAYLCKKSNFSLLYKARSILLSVHYVLHYCIVIII
jgi:hypothetical protein